MYIRKFLNCVKHRYHTYILTDYRLIMKKESKDRLDLPSEGAYPIGNELARSSSNSKLQTRPLVREDATK
jgi:hypothetical protein